MPQKAYIMKICIEFIHITNLLRLFTTPIDISKLYRIEKDEIISNLFKTLYQRKVVSLLFAAIVTKPDIALPFLVFTDLINSQDLINIKLKIKYFIDCSKYKTTMSAIKEKHKSFPHLFVLVILFLVVILHIKRILKDIS